MKKVRVELGERSYNIHIGAGLLGQAGPLLKDMGFSDDKVEISVKEIMGCGVCPLGLEIGDTWKILGEKIPDQFCSWAFQSIFPFVTVFRFGGKFPWSDDSDHLKVCCPDPNNPVVFELTRITEKTP